MTTTTTTTNARRQAEFRRSMIEKGFVKLTLWVPLAKVDAVKRLAEETDSDTPSDQPKVMPPKLKSA